MHRLTHPRLTWGSSKFVFDNSGLLVVLGRLPSSRQRSDAIIHCHWRPPGMKRFIGSAIARVTIAITNPNRNPNLNPKHNPNPNPTYS